MTAEPAAGNRYRFIVRGEIGDRFAAVFDGMQLERAAGTTVITGNVVDQAHLLGLVERIQELGLELVSLEQEDQPAQAAHTPRS
jgi:hypothetical protein